PLRARVLVALVAQHAVMNLAEDVARPHARVGQPEAVARTQPPVGTDHAGNAGGRLRVDGSPGGERLRKSENHPGAICAIANAGGTPPFEGFLAVAGRWVTVVGCLGAGCVGAGWLGAGWLGAGCMGAGCRSVEDGAAGTRQGQFAIVDALLRDHLL